MLMTTGRLPVNFAGGSHVERDAVLVVGHLERGAVMLAGKEPPAGEMVHERPGVTPRNIDAFM